MNMKQAVLALGVMLTGVAAADNNEGTELFEAPLIADGIAQMTARAERSRDWSGLDLFLEIADAKRRVEADPASAAAELEVLLELASKVEARYAFDRLGHSAKAGPALAHGAGPTAAKDILSCALALGAVASARAAATIACTVGSAAACGAAVAALAGAMLFAAIACEDTYPVIE